MKKELKFEDMSMTDFIRMAKKNGYEVQVNEDKKLAIECLKELKETLSQCSIFIAWATAIEWINNKIKELEERK